MGLEHAILWLLKKPYGKPIVALLVIAVGVFFSLIFLPQWHDTRLLQRSHATVTADVIDVRVSSGAHGFGSNYDLRYRFKLRDRGPWFYAAEKGPLARSELWSSLPKEQWETATRTGKVEVIYLPSDPNVNDLLVNLPRLAMTLYLGATFSLVPLVGGSLWLLYLLLRWIIRVSSDDAEENPWRVSRQFGGSRQVPVRTRNGA